MSRTTVLEFPLHASEDSWQKLVTCTGESQYRYNLRTIEGTPYHLKLDAVYKTYEWCSEIVRHMRFANGFLDVGIDLPVHNFGSGCTIYVKVDEDTTFRLTRTRDTSERPLVWYNYRLLRVPVLHGRAAFTLPEPTLVEQLAILNENASQLTCILFHGHSFMARFHDHFSFHASINEAVQVYVVGKEVPETLIIILRTVEESYSEIHGGNDIDIDTVD